jgi:hypothetical protein
MFLKQLDQCNITLLKRKYSETTKMPLAIRVTSQIATRFRLWRQLLSYPFILQSMGLTISNNLKWNNHVSEIIKKAARRIYFLIQLKRANVPSVDLALFYKSCIRSVVDYAAAVFHYSLPQYILVELERIQKRALSIIFPCYPYN